MVSNIKRKAKDLGILVAVTIPLFAVLSLPGIMKEVYVRNTTKSLRTYHVHIDDKYTKDGIDYMKVSGDTICALPFFPLKFEEGKDYDIRIRTYGFKFMETYRVEK